MKRFEKHIRRETDKIRMMASERRAVREQLTSYMAYHPIVAKGGYAAAPRADGHFYLPWSSWYVRSVGIAAAFFVCVIIPVSAERAAPGDVLYPVKVRVNEEVMSSLSLTPYQKVAWEAHRVERRITEARMLAKEGRLTDEVEAQITETVKEHAASAKKELAILRADDADEAAVAEVVLSSALEVQSAVLDTDLNTLAADASEDGEQTRSLIRAVKDAQTSFASADDTEETISSYERFVAEIEEATMRARDLQASLDGAVQTEEADDVTRRLEDIGRKVLAAQDSYAQGSTSDAVRGLKDALGDTQKLIAFMTDIDVRNSVDIEQLVPKELTADERKTLLVEARQSIASSALLIEARLASSTAPEALHEKIGEGLIEIQQHIATIDVYLTEGGSLEEAESAQHYAMAFIHDLLAVTAAWDQPENLSEEGADKDDIPVAENEATTTDPGTGANEGARPQEGAEHQLPEQARQ